MPQYLNSASSLSESYALSPTRFCRASGITIGTKVEVASVTSYGVALSTPRLKCFGLECREARTMGLSTGLRLGSYEVLDPLGAGGMGDVYRGRDTRLGRDVALKLLPANLLCEEISVKRFQRGARTASSLNHPHICTVYDVGEQDGTHYIAMELMEGPTLAHVLAAGPLPIEDVLRLGIQIADGLDAAPPEGCHPP